jgi:hypothetical protein
MCPRGLKGWGLKALSLEDVRTWRARGMRAWGCRVKGSMTVWLVCFESLEPHLVENPQQEGGFGQVGECDFLIFWLLWFVVCWIYWICSITLGTSPGNNSFRILTKWSTQVHLADACFSLQSHQLVGILTQSLLNGTPRVLLAWACFSLWRHHLVRILKESLPDEGSMII